MRRAEAETRLAEADRAARSGRSRAFGSARGTRRRGGARRVGGAAAGGIAQPRSRRARPRRPTSCERAEIKDGAELPPLDQAEKRVEKLKAEREQLGGVNLRAEAEAAEQEQRLRAADRPRRPRRRDRAAAARHPDAQPRRARAPARIVREGERQFRARCSRSCSRAARRGCTFTESEDPLEAGLEILAAPARQEADHALAALRRRAGADRDRADLRRVPGQSGADLRARRSGRAARRRQRRPLLPAARRDDAARGDALPRSSPTTR